MEFENFETIELFSSEDVGWINIVSFMVVKGFMDWKLLLEVMGNRLRK